MMIKIIDGKKSLNFGYCKVVEDRSNFFGVYKDEELLIHRPTWKQATKIASLIQEAFKDGYAQGYYDGSEW